LEILQSLLMVLFSRYIPKGLFEDSIEDFVGWYTYTFGEDNWRNMDEIKEELKAGNIKTYRPRK